ncbi:MAG: flagellar basal body P-ring formation chaperone FlgA [Acetobacteraceae bacterium]|nr:flagellar basal body P-ring formation chaperone FlgA [Acetobacteraceae bacterium]
MKTTALLAAIFVSAVQFPTSAATLKPLSTLTGSSINLSDLWDGVTVDKALAPAPPPGARMTVPAAQLAAIARDYGVDWRPNSSGDRVILERPGRAITRDDVKPAIVAALPTAGIAADAELEIGTIAADPVAADAKLRITVAQLDVDQASGRFTALLTVASAASPDTQLRLVGHVMEMAEVPVLRRHLLPGDIIGSQDLTWLKVRANLTRGDIVHAPAQAIGLAAKRSIQPGQVIATAELGRATIISKGESVTLSLESPGLSVSARAIATEAGGMGDRIRVLNELAHTTVEAEITAAGRARVIPGTARPSTRFVAAR